MQVEYPEMFDDIFKGCDKLIILVDKVLEHFNKVRTAETSLLEQIINKPIELPITRRQKVFGKFRGPTDIQDFEHDFTTAWNQFVISFIQAQPSITILSDKIQTAFIDGLNEAKNDFSKQLKFMKDFYERAQHDYDTASTPYYKAESAHNSAISALEDYKKKGPEKANEAQYSSLVEAYKSTQQEVINKSIPFNEARVAYTTSIQTALNLYENATKKLFESLHKLLDEVYAPLAECGVSNTLMSSAVEGASQEFNVHCDYANYFAKEGLGPIPDHEASIVKVNSLPPCVNYTDLVPPAKIFGKELNYFGVVLKNNYNDKDTHLVQGQIMTVIDRKGLKKQYKVMNDDSGETYTMDPSLFDAPESLKRVLYSVKRDYSENSQDPIVVKQGEIVMGINKDTANDKVLCITAFYAKGWIPLSHLQLFK